MKSSKLLKEASVLLISAIIVLSTAAVTANTTNEEEENQTCLSIKENSEIVSNNYNVDSGYRQSSNRAELWDNGLPDGRNGVSCVLWPSYPLDRENWLLPNGRLQIVHLPLILQKIGYNQKGLPRLRLFLYRR